MACALCCDGVTDSGSRHYTRPRWPTPRRRVPCGSQRAPERLIGRSAINILARRTECGLWQGSGLTSESPYGQDFMLVPHMRGG
ncbi:MAG: hypothetical protein P8X89_15690 [Reinekea sp.]